MALRGFKREVLIEILNGLGIKYLATSKDRWELTQIVESDTSIFRIGLNARLANIAMYFDRLKTFEGHVKEAKEKGDERSEAAYSTSIKILKKLLKDDIMADKEYMTNLYEREHNIYNSRSFIEFPLDKLQGLNALYDDFSVTFLFTDNISTVGVNRGALLKSFGNDMDKVAYFCNLVLADDKEFAEKLMSAKSGEERSKLWQDKFGQDMVDKFEAIEDIAERERFVADNIEFTNCLLGGAQNPNWAINVYGEIDKTLSKFEEGKQQVLPESYSDFERTTLEDTLKIKNRDLMQIMQSKIDIDRENLEVVDEKNIGGDDYKMVKLPKPINGRTKYLIRFVCPSTQRVYHVDVETNSLGTSKYYKNGEPLTYIDAWWQITHGGMDPKQCEYVIRT